ncbi:phosphoribosylaminoimidazolesuccinocarboxamide synthase [Ignavigranum ruoffiae]|uniref:phosphoribosylaminoimidazolesuccinocarboxamide synthase n=1 Tax=Ignavigranum ruoffiae TaxID=89093 RepID=A0A1H8ZTG3_9LACT|nr:phosphoribosylaminoimidazolesuccinocarboxamide synthase [Ignavigranum ruoffiae]SEP67058.1 phosphoribosylaminoimidazole-succinocarboxamide synthase [Ignavigranum ruoffiae]
MEKIYQGKTKDVYQLESGDVRLLFKDSMTGKDGVFDPGENAVGLEVAGSGQANLQLTQYFFEKMQVAGIATHYLEADLQGPTMDVRPVSIFGKGLEVICRFKAAGSFIKRYGDYIEFGQDLPAYVEISLKDDQRQDPFISAEALDILGILSKEDYQEIRDLTIAAAKVVRDELAKHDLTLFDIKFEFGRDKETGQILLIDEISGGNMRVFDANHQAVDPLDLAKVFA